MIGRVPDKGYCFRRTEFQLTQEWVADYVGVVEDSAIGAEVTPPMAVATQAIRILLSEMPLPPGALHGGQDLEFLRPVGRGEQLSLQARVANNSSRRGLTVVAVDLVVEDKSGATVMRGRSTIMASAE